MIISKNPTDIAKVLRQGGIIAYPTEGVWGLGCDPFNEQAVIRLLTLKSRPVEKGMILIAGHPDQLTPWRNTLPPILADKLISPCEKPTTWIVNDKNIAPSWIRGRFDSTAIRLSQHIGVKALCEAFGGPIVSTSANPSTQEPATSLAQVKTYFSSQLEAIFDDVLGTEKQPSQIKYLTDGTIARQ